MKAEDCVTNLGIIRAIKQRGYQHTYNIKHPEAAAENSRKYRSRHPLRFSTTRARASGWKSPEEVSDLLVFQGKVTHVAVEQARIDERKVLGKWLKDKQNPDEMWIKIWEADADALLRGERP